MEIGQRYCPTDDKAWLSSYADWPRTLDITVYPAWTNKIMIQNFLTIFRYSELIKALVGRDLQVRYKKSILGYAWTWLDPLMTMFVFILVFDIILSMKVKHFPVYLLSGLIPWIFFSNSIGRSLNSISGNTALIKRVYYPREIFPITITLGNLVNMFLSLLVLIPIILVYRIEINFNVLFCHHRPRIDPPNDGKLTHLTGAQPL